MATEGTNLSSFEQFDISSISDKKIAIVVSEWNDEITNGLKQGVIEVITSFNFPLENVIIHPVPGTYELALGAQFLLENETEGVICIGSVIRGETSHFDYVCQAAAQGIKDVALKYNSPVMFCVLTDDTKQQAIDRSGGKHGNKGVEAAVGLFKMLLLKESLSR